MPESLELREAEGAFEHLEEWLAARGFFSDGAEELVAEVYLGYALSDAIRRDARLRRSSHVLDSRWPHAASNEEPLQQTVTRARSRSASGSGRGVPVTIARRSRRFGRRSLAGTSTR